MTVSAGQLTTADRPDEELETVVHSRIGPAPPGLAQVTEPDELMAVINSPEGQE